MAEAAAAAATTEGGEAPSGTPTTGLPTGGLNEGATETGLPSDEGWRTQLGSVSEDPRLEKFGTPEAMAKSYLELESQQGTSIRIPGEDAGADARKVYLEKLRNHAPELMVRPDPENEEQMDAFYATAGRPIEAAGYTVPELKDAQGNKIDTPKAEAFREIAFKAGLSKTQFDKIMTEVTNSDVGQLDQQHGQFLDDNQQLREEWGATYDARYRGVARMAINTGAPPEVLELLKTGYARSPLLKWLNTLSEQLGGEGMEIGGQGGGSEGHMTPGEAQERLTEMMDNREHPLWNSHHPAHKAAVDKRVQLQRYISGDN